MKFAAVFACFTSAALAACAYLPTAGPTKGQVIDGAVQNNQIRYDVIDVNSNVVSTLMAQPAASFRSRFGAQGKPPPPRIGIGDTISVSIWEASGGGLFGAAPIAGVSAGSRNVTIPDQVVARDGAISMPFAGRIPVAGRTLVDVQRTIEQRLAQKAIEPQTIVTDTSCRGVSACQATNAATVSGEVVQGARVPLSVNGDHLLDLIALAGGAKSPVYETYVRLSRNGQTVTIPMEKLVSDPRENIYAWPGDVLTLVRIPQTFSVFGAAANNAQVNFTADNMTLAEALANARGLLDQRADPAGVFLFRFEAPAVVDALGAPQLGTGPYKTSPVVYRLDFSDAQSYFLAQHFPVADKDVIYVANARLNELQKFFNLLNTITGPIITGIVVSGSTGNGGGL
ncbi:MAG: polysaccharide export protein [Alphaproteobacteria bacterium]|nr:polysaccharide export protein [Alphaproteobacteria bacterium]